MYIFIYFPIVLKICPAMAAIFDFWSTDTTQTLNRVICGFWEVQIWNFSQSESITDRSSHAKFQVEQESYKMRRTILVAWLQSLVPFNALVCETKTEMWKGRKCDENGPLVSWLVYHSWSCYGYSLLVTHGSNNRDILIVMNN